MNALPQKNLLDFEPALPFVQSDLTASFSGVEAAIGEKYVIFILNEEVYAVSAKFVTEVIVPLTITPLPKTPEWVLGIANLRGKIISVIDLPGFWNKANLPSTPKSKLILLTSKNDDSQIAFAVDRVCEIIVLPNGNIQSGGDNSPDFCRKIKCKSGIINLLDAEKLFQSLKINMPN